MVTINIATDFAVSPGIRYYTDGPKSGQEFRDEKLEPLFSDPNDERPITIILDGTDGYATSFLEEAFGGIAENYGIDRCLRRFTFVSEDDETLVDEIMGYINDAEDR